MKAYAPILLGFFIPVFLQGQDVNDAAIFTALYKADSLLFERAYNQVDTAVLRDLLAEDIEMYHDQQGVIKDKEIFIKAMGSLSQLPFKARRALKPGSLEVFPMYQQGSLYGALQYGEHTFYALEEGKPEYVTSSAKFMTLWLKEDDQWVVSRSLSYDHQAPKH